jgi:hypothetical protein
LGTPQGGSLEFGIFVFGIYLLAFGIFVFGICLLAFGIWNLIFWNLS